MGNVTLNSYNNHGQVINGQFPITFKNFLCTENIVGCVDPDSPSYNPYATIVGPCEYPDGFPGAGGPYGGGGPIKNYKYLIQTDWDNCLMSYVASGPDTFDADGIRYVSYPWDSNSVDGHIAWMQNGDGTATCINATRNYTRADANFAGINFIGQVRDVSSLGQSPGCYFGVGCCPEPPNGPYTLFNQPGTVLCNIYNP